MFSVSDKIFPLAVSAALRLADEAVAGLKNDEIPCKIPEPSNRSSSSFSSEFSLFSLLGALKIPSGLGGAALSRKIAEVFIGENQKKKKEAIEAVKILRISRILDIPEFLNFLLSSSAWPARQFAWAAHEKIIDFSVFLLIAESRHIISEVAADLLFIFSGQEDFSSLASSLVQLAAGEKPVEENCLIDQKALGDWKTHESPINAPLEPPSSSDLVEEFSSLASQPPSRAASKILQEILLKAAGEWRDSENSQGENYKFFLSRISRLSSVEARFSLLRPHFIALLGTPEAGAARLEEILNCLITSILEAREHYNHSIHYSLQELGNLIFNDLRERPQLPEAGIAQIFLKALIILSKLFNQDEGANALRPPIVPVLFNHLKDFLSLSFHARSSGRVELSMRMAAFLIDSENKIAPHQRIFRDFSYWFESHFLPLVEPREKDFAPEDFHANAIFLTSVLTNSLSSAPPHEIQFYIKFASGPLLRTAKFPAEEFCRAARRKLRGAEDLAAIENSSEIFIDEAADGGAPEGPAGPFDLTKEDENLCLDSDPLFRLSQVPLLPLINRHDDPIIFSYLRDYSASGEIPAKLNQDCLFRAVARNQWEARLFHSLLTFQPAIPFLLSHSMLFPSEAARQRFIQREKFRVAAQLEVRDRLLKDLQAHRMLAAESQIGKIAKDKAEHEKMQKAERRAQEEQIRAAEDNKNKQIYGVELVVPPPHSHLPSVFNRALNDFPFLVARQPEKVADEAINEISELLKKLERSCSRRTKEQRETLMNEVALALIRLFVFSIIAYSSSDVVETPALLHRPDLWFLKLAKVFLSRRFFHPPIGRVLQALVWKNFIRENRPANDQNITFSTNFLGLALPLLTVPAYSRAFGVFLAFLISFDRQLRSANGAGFSLHFLHHSNQAKILNDVEASYLLDYAPFNGESEQFSHSFDVARLYLQGLSEVFPGRIIVNQVKHFDRLKTTQNSPAEAAVALAKSKLIIPLDDFSSSEPFDYSTGFLSEFLVKRVKFWLSRANFITKGKNSPLIEFSAFLTENPRLSILFDSVASYSLEEFLKAEFGNFAIFRGNAENHRNFLTQKLLEAAGGAFGSSESADSIEQFVISGLSICLKYYFEHCIIRWNRRETEGQTTEEAREDWIFDELLANLMAAMGNIYVEGNDSMGNSSPLHRALLCCLSGLFDSLKRRALAPHHLVIFPRVALKAFALSPWPLLFPRVHSDQSPYFHFGSFLDYLLVSSLNNPQGTGGFDFPAGEVRALASRINEAQQNNQKGVEEFLSHAPVLLLTALHEGAALKAGQMSASEDCLSSTALGSWYWALEDSSDFPTDRIFPRFSPLQTFLAFLKEKFPSLASSPSSVAPSIVEARQFAMKFPALAAALTAFHLFRLPGSCEELFFASFPLGFSLAFHRCFFLVCLSHLARTLNALALQSAGLSGATSSERDFPCNPFLEPTQNSQRVAKSLAIRILLSSPAFFHYFRSPPVATGNSSEEEIRCLLERFYFTGLLEPEIRRKTEEIIRKSEKIQTTAISSMTKPLSSPSGGEENSPASQAFPRPYVISLFFLLLSEISPASLKNSFPEGNSFQQFQDILKEILEEIERQRNSGQEEENQEPAQKKRKGSDDTEDSVELSNSSSSRAILALLQQFLAATPVDGLVHQSFLSFCRGVSSWHSKAQ